MFAPRSQSMPGSKSDRSSPVSGSRMRAAMPGTSRPTLPTRRARMPVGFTFEGGASGRLQAMTGEPSVMP